jgi:acylphosphatase
VKAIRIRRRVIVRGQVQGVFFRDTVRRKARETGVAGWVKNRPDGTVEAVFEGLPPAVEQMIALASEGPPQARVDSVECLDEPPQGLSNFR